MCLTLDEDCLLPPVQSLNRLVRYTARILHLCRLNSKNRRGLSPALTGVRVSASSLESLKGFAHTSLLRGTKRVSVYSEARVLSCIVTSSCQPLPLGIEQLVNV